MNDKAPVDIEALFADGKEIDAAMAEAARNAMVMHKRMGYPAVSWENGRVAWIPPEEIVVEDSPNDERANGSPADR